MTFKDIQFKELSAEYGPDAKEGKLDLSNGYELSIIRHKHSYGGEKGLYEIGVYHKDNKSDMVIPEGWDDSVKGWLHPEGVEIEINGLEQDEAKFEKVRA